MTAAVEHIKKAIDSLAPDEARELFQELRRDFQLTEDDQADEEALIEAEWDAELDTRLQEIENGTVQLLTAEESERRSDAVFAKLGIERPVYRP
ncbi:MAG: addiction module protein [Prosthecobacter sp.]|uniref:addiction module protein n=1 Tax=Prosthecobacter sp. TaxID=1965333 RepID=UPI003BB2018D